MVVAKEKCRFFFKWVIEHVPGRLPITRPVNVVHLAVVWVVGFTPKEHYDRIIMVVELCDVERDIKDDFHLPT